MLAIICVGSGHRILSENALNRSDANVLKGCAPGSPPPSLDHGKARQCRQGKTGKDQKTGLRAARKLLCKAQGGSEIKAAEPPGKTDQTRHAAELTMKALRHKLSSEAPNYELQSLKHSP